jgi:hypothetical protein
VHRVRTVVSGDSDDGLGSLCFHSDSKGMLFAAAERAEHRSLADGLDDGMDEAASAR